MSEQTKHTPGQWSINGNKIDGNGYHLASINSHSTIEGQANASLIAAAPELLEALRDMLSGWKYIRETHGDLYGVGWDRAESKALAAIAKATK